MTELRVIERPEKYSPGRLWSHVSDDIAPGSMWRDSTLDLHGEDSNEVIRECWFIVLPNRNVWRTTETASGGSGNLWDVSGEPPNITVNPSIDDRDWRWPWHGFIRDGVCEP